MGLTKRTKKIIVIGSIIIGVCLIAMGIVSVVFGDSITAFVIKKLNDNLNTKVSVKSAEFSIFKRFPNASVIFNDVVISPNKDFVPDNARNLERNLIKCRHIYVDINIIKLLFKNYSIKRIVAEEGDLFMEINKAGISSFDIFKKTDDNGESVTSVDLNNITLKKMGYHYLDYRHDVMLEGIAHKFNMKGSIRGDAFDFSMAADLFSKSVLIQNVEYFANRNMETSFILKRERDVYRMETSSLSIEGTDMNLKMVFSTSEKSEIDLVAEAADVSLAGFQKLIPDEYQKNIHNFESKGKTNFILTVKGKTYGNFLPHVDFNFAIKNGTIAQSRSNIKLSNLQCSGSYTNGIRNNSETSRFVVNDFSSSLGSGQISGKFSYINFNQPDIALDLKTFIDLAIFRKFLSLDTIENMDGKLRGDVKLTAGFKNAERFTRESIRSCKIEGSLKISDGQFKLKNSNYLYNNISSEIILGNDFQFENLSLKIDNNDFFISGRLYDAVPYILNQTKTLNLKAELRSQNLDLSKYFAKANQTASNSKYNSRLLFPENLLAELNVSVSHFSLSKFQATNAIAHVNYKPGMYTLNSVVFETMEGRVSGNGAVILDAGENLVVRGQTSLKKLDIKKLFYSFGNFGQSIIEDKHLKGFVTGDIMFACEWDKNMVLNQDAVLVESTIEISNGELINFEPLAGLSNFVELKELKDIKFSTLRNQVFIRHKQIILPNMDINSSALNISGSGIHNFDNHYTYHINVLLSEVLARKARQNKKENEEFGVVEDDGLGRTRIPLLIVGFDNDYKITYDTKGVKEIVKESLQKQKNELKTIFKDEFGFYKNDSTVTKAKSGTKYNIQWDERSPEKKEPEKTTKKKKKTFEEEEGIQVEFEK